MYAPCGRELERGGGLKCKHYMNADLNHIKADYRIGTAACGLCQTKVPCEFTNPAKKVR
jgi:transcription elongation factor Elf1